MRVLGIETSCDETAVCVIEATGEFGLDFRFEILGNALLSQAALHAQYGGVFPNLAKREHAKNLVPMLEKALNLREIPATKISKNVLSEILHREPELLEKIIPYLETHEKPDIDCIAVTYGPGLEPALWVGVNFAKALSAAWNIPIVGVNHMEGHIVLSMMEKNKLADFQFPVLALLISGGHTELVFSKEFPGRAGGRYEIIGQTRDDAAGEAFDKVARLLELPYPGGPEISRLAEEVRAKGGAQQFSFAPPMLHSKDYDFSFSGLKTEVRRTAAEHAPLSDETKKQLAWAFENAVSLVLVAKTLRAVEEFGAATVVVGGGVSANTFIRSQLAQALVKSDSSATLLVPPPELATDNALMIALAGYFHALKKEFAGREKLTARGNLALGKD